jgi:hypothetical protein
MRGDLKERAITRLRESELKVQSRPNDRLGRLLSKVYARQRMVNAEGLIELTRSAANLAAKFPD